jgi:hypothetical protein
LNLLIVIPSYNHNKYLPELLKNLINYNVLIIDDGSPMPISSKLVKNNINLIRNNENRGKGYSIKKAAKYAMNNKFTHILTIDSDMQHKTEDVKSFISSIKNNVLIYGYRSNLKNMPYLRILSNKITSYLISKVCKQKIYDSQCGYRLYDLCLFKNLNSKEDGYQFESEILLKSITINSMINYVDIETIYNNSPSYFSKIEDTFKFIKMYITIIFKI